MKDAYLAGQVVPDIDVAKAAYTILDSYRWVPEPSAPPEVVKFNGLAPDVKKKMRLKPEEASYFWNDPKVIDYYDSRLKVKHLNQRNKDWLIWLLKMLPEYETEINLQLYKFKESYHQDLGIEQPDWSNS